MRIKLINILYKNSKMKICSFDVGIKNLSYCIGEFNKENFEIIDWDNIDLIDSRIKKICCGKLKNKKECNKIATYENTNRTLFFCKTHLEQYNKPESKLVFESYNDKERCKEKLKNDKICDRKARYKYLEKPICLTCHKKIIKKEDEQLELHKIKNVSANAISPQDLSMKLIDKLDKKENIRDVDMVLIENQPSLKNPKMASLSNFLYFYFVIRGIVDEKRISKVNFKSPSNKIKANEEYIKLLKDEINEDSPIIKSVKKLLIKYNNIDLKDKDKIETLLKEYDLLDISKNIVNLMLDKNYKVDDKIKKIMKSDKKCIYDITKNLGIQYTKLLNRKNNDWVEHLDKFKKQDDLCDAFLQAYYFSCQS